MNNLLRTLTESHIKPTGDLRLLLTTVKEGRRQTYDNNNKLTDPFYDSLEGLLLDLKTITIDNRDAEAFLKPVSKAEVPDYYDVIQNPMDFQTMLKKVKSKQYKSKREFKDDLELIWSNCLTYNAAETHPLRPCVHRLKAKAERLLKYITDRKERSDPPIPSDLPAPIAGVARPRINGGHSRTNSNGYLNGRGSSHTRSSSISSMTNGRLNTIILPPKNRKIEIDFGESPAIIRTPEGMARFLQLEREVGISKQQRSELAQELRELALPIVELPTTDDGDEVDVKMEDVALGEKRKIQQNGVERPRKKARYLSQVPMPLADEQDDITQLWWNAVQGDAMLGNGLPGIPFGPSSSSPRKSTSSAEKKAKKNKGKGKQLALGPPNPKALLNLMNNNIKTMRRVRHTHNKFAALKAAAAPAEDEEGNVLPAEGGSTGLGGGPSAPAADGEDDVVEDAIDERPWMLIRGLVPSSTISPSPSSSTATPHPHPHPHLPPPPRADARAARQMAGGVEIGERSAADCMRWSTNKILEHAGFQGTSSVALDVLSDVMAEYLSNVGRTIRFLTDKFGQTMSPEEIILHTLFESGSSKVQDLERYISDDVERYGVRLGELEKKLVGAYRETTAGEALEDGGLFDSEGEDEHGALAMGDFADLLGEDYLGFRELGLTDEFGLQGLTIPKKMLKGKKGANKPTALKPTEPPPPYPPPPPFVPLIAAKVDEQIGLLKPYYENRFGLLAAATAPQQLANLPGPSLPGPSLPGPSLPGPSLSAPPVPTPTMPPPLQGPRLGVNTLPSMPATAMLPPPPPASTSTLPMMPANAPPIQPPAASTSTLPSGAPNATGVPAPAVVFPPPNPDLALPDDAPNPAQVKIGPIGQIIKPSTAASAAKKKAAAAPAAAKPADGPAGVTLAAPGAGHGVVVGLPAGAGASAAPAIPVGAAGTGAGSGGGGSADGDNSGQSPSKKKKLNNGAASGNANRKKKPEGGGANGLPPVVIASA